MRARALLLVAVALAISAAAWGIVFLADRRPPAGDALPPEPPATSPSAATLAAAPGGRAGRLSAAGPATPGPSAPIAREPWEALTPPQLKEAQDRIAPLRAAVRGADPAAGLGAFSDLLGLVEGSDPYLRLLALEALRGATWMDARLDLRGRLVRWVDDPDPYVATSALRALHALAPDASDGDRLLALIQREPGTLGDELGRAIAEVADGALTGAAGDTVADWFQRAAPSAARRFLAALGPRLEASERLRDVLLRLTHSTDPETAELAVARGLDRLAQKDKAVLTRLWELVTTGTPSERPRARAALQRGVADGDAMAFHRARLREVLETLDDPALVRWALEMLRLYGIEDHLPVLRRLEANDLAPAEFRTAAGEVRRRIERKT
jgi:hypothetical protein